MIYLIRERATGRYIRFRDDDFGTKIEETPVPQNATMFESRDSAARATARGILRWGDYCARNSTQIIGYEIVECENIDELVAEYSKNVEKLANELLER